MCVGIVDALVVLGVPETNIYRKTFFVLRYTPPVSIAAVVDKRICPSSKLDVVKNAVFADKSPPRRRETTTYTHVLLYETFANP